jgi:threonine/homoserine/homoserine lactone efflux protein
MTIDAVLPLILFAGVATITPGGATTMATASGARFGFRRSVPLMAGSSLGLATLAVVSGAGLAGLLLGAPSLKLAMKLIGSTYLLWLAWKVGRSGAPKLMTSQQMTDANSDRLAQPASLLGGASLLWFNPKGWAMTLGAAASFAALAANPLQLAVLLGAAFGLAAALSLSLWCVAGFMLARLLRSERQWHLLNAVLGLLLAASVIPMWLA